jgi:protein-tyrosine phosphatase
VPTTIELNIVPFDVAGRGAGRSGAAAGDHTPALRATRMPSGGVCGSNVQVQLIDLHCHVLPGIDDGPATLEDSVALARAAAAGGTRTIVATPHVSWDMPNEAATIAGLVEELNARLEREGVELRVRPGAEVAITRAIDLPPEELAGLSLGGGPWVLIEPPFSPLVAGLEGLFDGLRRGDLQIVVAHPERCPGFHRDPDALARLVEAGALTSITASSLGGRFGRDVRRFAHQLVERGLVHNVASDAHDSVSRPPALADELRRSGYDWLAGWAAQDVPAAILAGEPIPPRPARPADRSRHWWQRRR